LLHSGEMQLRQHHDEKSGILAENAALREQLQKMMNMRGALPAQFGSQWPPAAPEPAQTAQQSQLYNESASFAHGTPSHSRRDIGASTFPASSASQVSHSPWTHTSSAAHVPSAAQPSSMFTPSAAASAVATPLWSHAGSRGGQALGMSFASQMEATGGAGRQDESSELLKQQCVLRVALALIARGANSAFRYAALVQEANRIKQEYKSIRAQVSTRSFPPPTLFCRLRARAAGCERLMTFGLAAAVVSPVASARQPYICCRFNVPWCSRNVN
jgi:hypothetical protein